MSRTMLDSDEESIVERREAELGAAVMRYLAEHPHAMDNLQGIAEWWVMRQQVRVEVNMLKRVLQQLTENGLLEEVKSAEGPAENPLYRLKR